MKKTKFDKRFDFLVTVMLAMFLFIVIYPLYFICIASISSPAAVTQGAVTLLPKDVTLEGYKRIIQYDELWLGYRNTIIYVVLDMIVSLSITVMTGYAISRKNVPGMKGLMIYMVIPMYFGGGLIPTYLLVKQLGLVGNPLYIIISSSTSIGNIIVTRAFMKSNVPDELYEAASMDGCSHIRFLWSICVPLCQAIIAVICLNNAVGMWNSWFGAMIYVNKSEYMPLQFKLRTLLLSSSTLYEATSGMDTQMGQDMMQQQMMVESMKYGVIVVSALPLLVLYPFLQKYFVKGIMVGSLKG